MLSIPKKNTNNFTPLENEEDDVRKNFLTGENMKPNRSKQRDTFLTGSNFFYAVSLGLELGFLIALPLVFFLALGLFLDKKLKTLPIFLISSIILGLAATVINVYYLILPFLEKRSKNKK